MDVVYHHIPGLGDDGPELVPALLPQRTDGSRGQRSKAVAAGQKEDRVLLVGMQRNAQAVDGFPDWVQPNVLMRTDPGSDGRHLYQHVLPGEDRLPPWEKRVHYFPHLSPAQ